LGSHPAQPDGLFWDAIVELPAAAVADVARLPQVLWLGYESPRPVLDDEMSDQIVAGNYTAGVPFVGYEPWLTSVGLDGTGVVWAIVDTGVDYDHPDLGSHIVGGYDFPGACVIAGQPGTDCPGGGHGTHVAGIVGGDATGGFTDPGGFLYGLGVAPSYSIFAMNSLSAAAWPPAGGWQEHSKRAVLGGALGGNNSWTTGEGTAHGYQASERTHDLMVRDGNFDTAAVAEPLVEVFSAGNSGPGASTLTSPKEAKNLIIVAASLNHRVGNIDTLASFSSRGPAVDGRHGITITTPGDQIASSRNDTGGSCSTAIGGTSNLYAYCSGTSMAAPHASGAVVMAAEWWRGFNAGADPSPAMAKALLVNSAVDMATPDIPNTNEGWGRVHLGNLFDATVNRVFIDQDELFGAAGEFREYTWGVPDTGRPLKITVAWADAAGAVGANPALVNNLNLTVTTGGNTYLGNVFAAGWSTTGGTVDVKNNIENVYVQNPGGSVTIRIDAANVPGDGVPYNGDPTDQDFALVCTNCVQAADFSLDATPGSLAICAPANAEFTVDVGAILGFSAPVTLAASGHPAGTTAGFSTNTMAPPFTSTLTIGNTGAGAPGTYPITISGTASGSPGHVTPVELVVAAAAPGAPTLQLPLNTTSGVPLRPDFQWSAVAGAADYTLEVDDDPAFGSIDYTVTQVLTTHTATSDLSPGTVYSWRVRASNACGAGADSTVFRFATAVPGEACSAGPITIPDSGTGSPYPSAVTVSTGATSVPTIQLQLNGLTHTFPDDIDVLLVGPGGQTLVVMSDVGGGTDVNAINLTLDDTAAALLPDSGPLATGTYRPSNVTAGDAFAAPAPAGPHNNPAPAGAATFTSTFGGTDPNGTWNLFLVDDAGGDSGSLAQWCVAFGAADPMPFLDGFETSDTSRWSSAVP
ncbi:MAG: S8 family serine peptidase, partial [Thermoanaerobaculia bacterium]